MADERPLGDRVIGWYGNVAARGLAGHPDFTRNWLMMGYQLMRMKSRYLPNKDFHPAGQQAYSIFMDSIVGAMADTKDAVLTSIFLPTEPLRALGLKPMCAEAVASFASGAQAEHAFVGAAEGAGVPQTYCSYHKVLMGLAESGILEAPPLLASCSVVCDANNLTFKTLSRLWKVPHVYIDVPFDITRDACLYVADQLRDMTRQAEDVYSRKLDEELLRKLVRDSDEATRRLNGSLHARRGRYLANTMTLEMMGMLDLHLMNGSPRVMAMTEQMERDLEKAPAFDGLNIVWAHTSPYFLGSIGRYVDCSQTAQIVGSDMTFDRLLLDGDPWFGADRPFEYLAERLVRNCFNGPVTRRTETIRYLADETDADGIVIFCHWGCRQTAGAAQMMRRELEAAGYPVLVLDGDAVDRQNCAEGQMSTRFSAFIELLQARREEARHDR